MASPLPESEPPVEVSTPPRRNTGARVRFGLGIALAVLGIALGASGFARGPARITTDDASAVGETVAPTVATKHCETATYSLDYPADWFTAPDRDGSTCGLFHPVAFESPSGAGTIVEVAIRVRRVDIPIAKLDAEIERIHREDFVGAERKALRVGGRPAVLHTAEFADGDPAAREYLVDLGGDTLYIHVQSNYAADFTQAARALDVIAASVVFK